MIPNLSPAGRSFKGAFAYHMHDKEQTDTAERVGWTASRNLVTDDARTAERVMIATAKDADRLKDQAGIKSTGRKSASHVQTLSLSWHPGEAVSREEMERAADSALKELGLQEHQAYLVAHTDRAHPHVHIIVNRVNPQDGRLATLSNSKRILDQWAHTYEADRGQIVTPKRAEKFARREQAAKQYSPEERRAFMEGKRKERAEQAEKRQQSIKAAGARDVSTATKAALAGDGRATQLQAIRDYQAVLRSEHKAEREALWQNQKAEWKEVSRTVSDSWKARKEKDAPRSKEEFRELAQRQFKAERDRRKLERSATGRLALAITASLEQRRMMQERGEKSPSMAKLLAVNLISKNARSKVFDEVKRVERERLSRKQYERLRAEGKTLLDEKGADLKAKYSSLREDLTLRQKEDRDHLYQAWRENRAEALIYGRGQSADPRGPEAPERPAYAPREAPKPDPMEFRPASYAKLERLAELQREGGKLQYNPQLPPREHGAVNLDLDPGAVIKRLRADREHQKHAEKRKENERDLQKARRDLSRDR